MIKGNVCTENVSPREARQGINKQTSRDPFSMQFGPFDNWFALQKPPKQNTILHTTAQPYILWSS